MKIVVLGSGTSHGIPVVGCTCPVCTSNEIRDKRMRASIYIEGAGGERVLIDAGPEFRLQALRAGISGLDAILLTHSHADHLHGLDDVRPLSCKKHIPVYGNKQTIAEMTERFSYVFGKLWGRGQLGGGKPRLLPRIVDGPLRIGSLVFTPVPVKHGVLDILGWEVTELSGKPVSSRTTPEETTRISFLYLTDTSAIPPSSLERLRPSTADLRRVIIIGALRVRPHETHFTFEDAMNTAVDLGAKEIYLTHLCHEHSHAEIEGLCRHFAESHRASGRSPEGIEINPAWDGLEIVLADKAL